jgi:alpha-1,3-glucan synthase
LQYGDIEAFGVHFDWQRQLAKFASVQDRLREWEPSVRAKIEHFSCLTIMMLDIDGFRLDKATQITVDALGDFGHAVRKCARSVGKENFFIAGEIAGGNTFGSIYLGRGRQPDMKAETLLEAVTTINTNRSSVIRDADRNALDCSTFHYSIYRALTRFLGIDGNLEAGFDTPVNFVDAWNEIILTNDLVNANTGRFDPRHMFGVTNQDVFRWPAITQGTERMLLGHFVTTLHMPGIPLLLWGEEQAFYTLDNTASNYLSGRQAMSSAPAWEMHSCYKTGSAQYHDFPLEAALHGCEDPWNALDHRDPTNPVRNILKSMYQMRKNYPVLNDGWFLQQLSNQTHDIYLPGSNGTRTEVGMWSTMRGHFAPVQDLSGDGRGLGNQSVWLLYQNDNKTVKYPFDCAETTRLSFRRLMRKLLLRICSFRMTSLFCRKDRKGLGSMDPRNLMDV